MIEKIEGFPFKPFYKIFGIEITTVRPNLNQSGLYTNGRSSNFVPARLFFTCILDKIQLDWDEARSLFSFQDVTLEESHLDQIYLLGDGVILQFAWGGEYYIQENRIDCHLRKPARLFLVEPYLTGQVMAFWLERHYLPVLHASAVMAAGKAIAFLSQSGNGKSSLAAASLQVGAALLTDDILPLEEFDRKFFGRPGLPQINMWPDQASYFLAKGDETTEHVSINEKKQYNITVFKGGVFCQESQPLACLYIPERYEVVDGEFRIEIITLPAVEAMIELLRFSFISPSVCEEMGWQGRRMEFFARLVEKVPVRRLRYPSGFEYLPAVVEAVMRDAER